MVVPSSGATAANIRSPAGGTWRAASWKEGKPATVIFASSTKSPIGMIEVFREKGISIPEDLSIIGFDDVSPLHLLRRH